MNISYLLPHTFKKVGWLFFIPTLLFGIPAVLLEYEPSFLDVQVPALSMIGVGHEKKLFAFIENNILNEILGVLMIVSGTPVPTQ